MNKKLIKIIENNNDIDLFLNDVFNILIKEYNLKLELKIYDVFKEMKIVRRKYLHNNHGVYMN